MSYMYKNIPTLLRRKVTENRNISNIIIISYRVFVTYYKFQKTSPKIPIKDNLLGLVMSIKTKTINKYKLGVLYQNLICEWKGFYNENQRKKYHPT